MEVVFWHSILSPHQSAYIRELSAREGVSVTVVAERAVLSGRQELGWVSPHLGNATVVLEPSEKEAHELVRATASAVHIVEGVRKIAVGRIAFSTLARCGGRVGMISECPDRRGWTGVARRYVYLCHGLAKRRAISFVLAIGPDAVSWYSRCGFEKARIFPFLYVAEGLNDASFSSEGAGERAVRLLYLGRLIPLKGIDVLLDALGGMKETEWRLTVVGEGPERERLQRRAARAGIGHRVSFLPALPNPQALKIIAASDLLILPSRQDGWGAVINEALMQGVPVICSDRCGARDLLREPWRGEVFKSGSPVSLRNALGRWIERVRQDPGLSRRIRSWSRCIEGESAAAYLVSILKCVYEGGPRPIPPWCPTDVQEHLGTAACRGLSQ